MKLTSQAQRILEQAVKTLPDRNAQSQFFGWASKTATQAELPHEIADIALQALTAESRKLEQRLSSTALDEDSEADLLNELGFIQAMEKSLRQEGVGG